MTLTLTAQPQPDGPPPRNQRPDAEARRPQPPLRPLNPGLGGLALGLEPILTPDQRLSLQESLVAVRGKTRELTEQIRTAQQALLKHALAEENTDASLQEHAQTLAKLEAQLHLIRLRALADVQPALTAEQVEQILALPPVTALLPQRQLRRPEGDFPAPQRPPRPDEPVRDQPAHPPGL